MQDVTDLPFLRAVAAFGGADVYVTEYFRVHIHSRLDPYILRSIVENPTGRPILAQMIGKDPAALKKLADDLRLENYGLIKSKNVKDITDYLSKKMHKSLTGEDPDEKDPNKIIQQMKKINEPQ